jgi:ABC-2 type transport system permease protein
MKKYLIYFRAMLSNSLEYRGVLFVWILVEVVALSSSLFLWTGIFRTNSMVGNYQLHGIISYYFLLPVIGAFTTIFLSESLPREIKDGTISPQLIKPYNFALFRLLNSIAMKSTQFIFKAPVYIIIGFLLWPLISDSVKIANLPLLIITCVLAYLLHFLLDYSLSLLAFWIEDTWSFSLLKQITILIFGGLAFPLSLVPQNVNWIFDFLPFKFIYYVPISVIQGKLSPAEIMTDFLQLIIWMVILAVSGSWLWKSGMKKYGAYGQ